MKAGQLDKLCDKLDSVQVEDESKENEEATIYPDSMVLCIEPAKIYMKDKDGDTLLHIAIILLKLKVSKLFISMATVRKWLSLSNRLFQTPLHLAVITNQFEVTKHLVAAGAEVESRDREGNTPLHIACREGFQQIVNCLIEHMLTKPRTATEVDNEHHYRADLQGFSIRNYEGVTILHLAATSQNYGVIGTLIENGINVNMKEGKTGRTVLHNACVSGDITLIKLLLQQRSCDINARAYDGSTPFDLARDRGHDMACMTLAAAGARYGEKDSDSEE